MTYLLAVGDSWTDGNYKPLISSIDCNFLKWPRILGNKLNFSRVVNLGVSGSSNAYIFSQCYSQILKEKPALVCVLLSAWDRRDIFNYQFNNCLNVHAHTRRRKLELRDEHWNEWLETFCNKEKVIIDFAEHVWENYANMESVMNETLINLFLFKNFCETNDIKYLIAQGIAPIDENYVKDTNPCDSKLKDYHEYLKHVLLSPYTDRISGANVINWPFFWELGGDSMEHMLYKANSKEVWLHERDHHPSAVGHQTIADYFYGSYLNVYKQKN